VSERVSLEDRAQEYAARCNPPQQHEATEQVLLAARKYAYIYGYRAALEDAAKACETRKKDSDDKTFAEIMLNAELDRCALAIRSLLEDGR
jgi:hypothetical protein